MKREAQQKSLLRLENVGISKSNKWLVRGVDLELNRGEIITLIGPNGSGKSTTTKIALGILDPSEGRVYRNPDLHVSYVPQKLTIDWSLPLEVSHFMHLTGKLSNHDVDEALAATGVAHLMDAQLRNLSGGEFQRVLLARAIARKPNLLVLDEPVQGVDFNGERQLYDLIKLYRDKSQCAVLLVSHDLHIVMAATDKVICLNGHVCCHGSPIQVMSSKAYQTLFGERASPSLAVYEHNHDHTHLPDGRVRHGDGTITDHCNHKASDDMKDQ